MEPLIRIDDIAYVRFAAPDLDEMQRFLEDFGLAVSRRDGRLYGRGSDGAPFLHATEPGEPKFVAVGFRADSVADLEKLATAQNVAVEDHDVPGGGFVVRLRDPDGYLVEVVAGQTFGARRPPRPEAARNTAAGHERLRQPVRLEQGPSDVMRLGHCVLGVGDFRTSEAWYKERFGFITSDEIAATPDVSIGAFMRCDRGGRPTDHHTLFLLQAPTGPAFNHAAFEVAGFDDLLVGHAHLRAHGRTQAWGVGRHKLGSQIFDYWKDPWGHELEHWTDGDVFTAADGSNVATLGDLLGVQWGEQHEMVRRMNEGANA